ncbi:S24 family peptidase [Pseudomonas tremae]|uniref:S24 family peptidase n=1 Tax=Pseudomonas tremae TaxID=200454 RepID=UPI001F3A2542|nr:S24 family peptidase [Pseudomonas tremae]MCF5805163.1 helix-turn-helix domain-containing protein [Pseudomonas tremae]MCF5811080.1 helix-turn-helix domain-containing protein [Pseudomonas tremae]
MLTSGNLLNKEKVTSGIANDVNDAPAGNLFRLTSGLSLRPMTKKPPLPPKLLAECQAANELYLSKKNELKLNKRKIADEIGVSPAAVAHYLSGVNALNVKFASALARLLGEPVDRFSPRLAAEIADLAATTDHSNVTPMVQPRREAREYPLITWVDAGAGIESAGSYPLGISDEWLSSTENAGPSGYWLRVKGKSMTSDTPPTFPEGTPILVRPEGFDIISGKFYVARHTVTGETTFKQYILDAGVGYLVPLNQAYQTVQVEGDWEIIGRAIDAKVTGM